MKMRYEIPLSVTRVWAIKPRKGPRGVPTPIRGKVGRRRVPSIMSAATANEVTLLPNVTPAPSDSVFLFSKPTCPYCKKAKRLLQDKGVECIDQTIENQPEEVIARMVTLSGGRRTVPQVRFEVYHCYRSSRSLPRTRCPICTFYACFVHISGSWRRPHVLFSVMSS